MGRICRQGRAVVAAEKLEDAAEQYKAICRSKEEAQSDVRAAQKAVEILAEIPIRYVQADLRNAIALAAELNIYAYDAYFLDCATRHTAPLLTLDRSLQRAATHLDIDLVEI